MRYWYSGVSNTMVTLPSNAVTLHYTASISHSKHMGARPRFARLCRAASALGASLVFNPAFSGRSSPLASPPWESWVESEQDTQRLLNQVSHSFGSGRRWCQSIILSTYLVFQILRIRCLHYKLRVSHWELWSLHAISIRYVQHYHHRWSCWPWTPTRNLRLINSW